MIESSANAGAVMAATGSEATATAFATIVEGKEKLVSSVIVELNKIKGQSYYR